MLQKMSGQKKKKLSRIFTISQIKLSTNVNNDYNT